MEKYLIMMTGLPVTGKTFSAGKLYEFLGDYEFVLQNDIRRNKVEKRLSE